MPRSRLQGLHVFEANPKIIQHLKEKGSLVRRETYDHGYPHCWRCDSPLIYRAINSWFVKVTDVKERMIKAESEIRWVPEHVRDGRFGKWLENARDWAIFRNRFWGAPIPVWKCEACKAERVFGGRAELEKASGQVVADWHRPAIDAITVPCTCGKTMHRVSDVLDCWFESGSMPYAQVHYPFENKAGFEATFPGDFIVEYINQTRGWFYTLVVLSAALFDERPFKDVVCHGVILAEDGRKMSKRLKNYPDPLEVVEEHGSDALRAALMSSAVVRGADLRFSSEAVRDAVRRICLPLWNGLHFFVAYARIDGFKPDPAFAFPNPTRLDRYLLSETEGLRVSLEEAMAASDFAACYERIEEFITLLSTWYIRLSKQRLWRSGLDADKLHAYHALYEALTRLAKLSAPFLPFLAESVHAALGGEDSVHLTDWPAPTGWRDVEISAEMGSLREVVRLARSIREDHRLKHRHPLTAISIAGLPAGTVANNLDLLKEELNVKSVLELANPDDVVRRVVKLDYGRLGKRLRGDVKKVQAAIDAGESEKQADGRLKVAGHLLDPEDFSFRYAAKDEGKGVAAAEKLVVVLDSHVHPGAHRGGPDARPQPGRAGSAQEGQAGLRRPDRPLGGGLCCAAAGHRPSPRLACRSSPGDLDRLRIDARCVGSGDGGCGRRAGGALAPGREVACGRDALPRRRVDGRGALAGGGQGLRRQRPRPGEDLSRRAPDVGGRRRGGRPDPGPLHRWLRLTPPRGAGRTVEADPRPRGAHSRRLAAPPRRSAAALPGVAQRGIPRESTATRSSTRRRGPGR